MTIVASHTKDNFATDVGQSLKAGDVVRSNRIGTHRGLPATIRVDNESKFISKAMDQWDMSAASIKSHTIYGGMPSLETGERPGTHPARVVEIVTF